MPLLCENRFLEDLILEIKNPNKTWECTGLLAVTQFTLGVTVASLRNTSLTSFSRGIFIFPLIIIVSFCYNVLKMKK